MCCFLFILVSLMWIIIYSRIRIWVWRSSSFVCILMLFTVLGNNYFSRKESFLFCLEFICQKCLFISLYLWNIILHTCQVSFLAITLWFNYSRSTTNLELVIHCVIVRNKTLQVCRLIFHKYRRMNKQLWKMNSERVVTMSVVVRCISVYL